MEQYKQTAGFPHCHIMAFKEVSIRNRMVIASRGVNPMCTDLILENYAAKGFSIKAKTCDWGPMAGFVPIDYRFTKDTQSIGDQRAKVVAALTAGAQAVPLVISDLRYMKLKGNRCFFEAITKLDLGQRRRNVVAFSSSRGERFEFALLKQRFDGGWAICYSGTDKNSHINFPLEIKSFVERFRRYPISNLDTQGLTPVMGLSNTLTPGSLDYKAAVCGDYDLWCLFPHNTLDAPGINDRLVPLRAKLIDRAVKNQDGSVTRGYSSEFVNRAHAAGLIFENDAECSALAEQMQSKRLGNISLALMRIRSQLNAACRGRQGGDVVMHGDYSGHPFGDIDYPLIFFVPLPHTNFLTAEHRTVHNIFELRQTLYWIQSLGYRILLNPAWGIRLFPL